MSATLQLQLDIASYLGANPAFQYVPVICEYRDEEPGNALFDDLVQKHLKGEIPKNGKCGLCVVVGTPDATTTAPNTPGPVEDFSIMLQIVENKTTNKNPSIGTGVRADDLYEQVKSFLHLWSHDGQHDIVVKRGEQDTGLPSTLRGFVIELESRAHLLPYITKTLMPVIGVSDPTMTITCGTAGASIYWTQDGSYPCVGNPSASLYASPVDVGELPSGTLIRAAAFGASPLRGSDCTFFIL